MNLDLRQAVESDLKTIIPWIPDEVECRYWGGTLVRFPIRLENLVQDIEYSESNSYCLSDGSHIIGFGQLLIRKPGYLHLARIIISPARRSSGYGRLLCEKLIQTGYEKGYRGFTLNVYRDNIEAIHLYKSLGFREAIDKSDAEKCHMIMQLTNSNKI